MAQSLSKILVHAIFSTKNRMPFLKNAELRNELNHFIGGTLRHLDCQPIIVNCVEDHVHFLCSLARTCDPANLIKETKRASSAWLKKSEPLLREFQWQGGYGQFSVGISQLEQTRQYIAKQGASPRCLVPG